MAGPAYLLEGTARGQGQLMQGAAGSGPSVRTGPAWQRSQWSLPSVVLQPGQREQFSTPQWRPHSHQLHLPSPAGSGCPGHPPLPRPHSILRHNQGPKGALAFPPLCLVPASPPATGPTLLHRRLSQGGSGLSGPGTDRGWRPRKRPDVPGNSQGHTPGGVGTGGQEGGRASLTLGRAGTVLTGQP